MGIGEQNGKFERLGERTNAIFIGEHHNIRKQIFSFFFGTRLSLFGGGGAREQVPPFPGGL